MSLLEARALRREFRSPSPNPLRRESADATLAAVDGVDLDLEPGGGLALVGESGSGKSTVARLVLRLLRPTSGTIRFLGRDFLAQEGAELRRSRREMQAVFQDPYGSLDPRWTIGETIAEPLAVHGLVARRELAERVRSLLAEVGLGELPPGRYPHELSGGQRQRVAVARALAPDPKLLVADEPASALDAPVRARLLELIAERRRARGLALLLIAHDLGSIRHVADRVAVMLRGRVVESGPVREILASPRHPYTAALVAAATPGANRKAASPVTLREGAIAAGCPFRLRCPNAAEPCRNENPGLRPVGAGGAGRAVACHFPVGPEGEPEPAP